MPSRLINLEAFSYGGSSEEFSILESVVRLNKLSAAHFE